MSNIGRNYSPERVLRFFTIGDKPTFTVPDLLAAEENGRIPHRGKKKSWPLSDIPLIGEKFGFLSTPLRPLVASVFVTKGGVLKSSLTLNLARLFALHNIRTCVIGLDMQGDITTALGFDHQLSEDLDFTEALAQLNSIRGLPDHQLGQVPVEDLLVPTDLPSLFFIPETPELVALEQGLNQRHRREYWLRDQVLPPLRERFDLILIDCAPNWNQLITNALVASDILISPLECKINNFRNFKMFETFIHEFRNDLQAHFEHLFVPTRLITNRKLSREICAWYQSHLPQCTTTAIRDSIQGEEAMAMNLSVPEFAPASAAADEIRRLAQEVQRCQSRLIRPTPTNSSTLPNLDKPL